MRAALLASLLAAWASPAQNQGLAVAERTRSPGLAEPVIDRRRHSLGLLAAALAIAQAGVAALGLDLDRRRTALQEAEAALRADRTLIPLCLVPASFSARPGVHGARLDASGRLLLEDAWTEP